MMKQGELLRIGELAKEAGVSLTTVKFLRQGGPDPPARARTGRNMAYYDRSCISTIGTIRRLQRERYYPLSVIKRLMESAPVEQVDLDLLDAIHKADAPDPGRARAACRGRARSSGLTAKQIALLTDSGALVPVREGRKKLFTADDLGVMALAKRRLDAGIPIEQTVRSLFHLRKGPARSRVRRGGRLCRRGADVPKRHRRSRRAHDPRFR